MEFVNFNLAKKLKEKGFNVPCIYAYCEHGGWNKYTQKREPITYILRTDANPFGTYYTGKNWNKEYETNKNKIQCSAPTISQVLKWLRDEKKLHVRASIYFIGWCVDVTNMDGKRIYSNECEYHNYKQAAIAGIEYVLDNLI